MNTLQKLSELARDWIVTIDATHLTIARGIGAMLNRHRYPIAAYHDLGAAIEAAWAGEPPQSASAPHCFNLMHHPDCEGCNHDG